MTSQGVTELLGAWGRGDRSALARLMPLVQGELRLIARGHLSRERPDHTLQPTELVNEAFIRLVDQKRVSWQDRAHFFTIAAQMMRRILVDHARRKRSVKRGAGATRVSLNDAVGTVSPSTVDIMAVDEALDALGKLDARQARVVELRFFGGLSVEETAAALGISAMTVKREWVTARAWLFHRLREGMPRRADPE